MPTCPKCTSDHVIKAGFVKGKQRYRCKSCNYFYTLHQKGASRETKRQALQLYLEGLGFRSIGRFLNYSHVAVYKWIKAFGEELEALKSDSTLSVVEMDEMHTYIRSKKTLAGYGFLLIEMDTDSSTAFLVHGTRKRAKNSGNA